VRYLAAFAIAGAILTVAGSYPVLGAQTGAPGTRLPEIVVEAPIELAAVAERVRQVDPVKVESLMILVGLTEPGAPIRVVLTPETSEAAQTTPSWVAGLAYGALGTIVLFPERSPSYPHDSLDEVLLHEIAHVFVARAAGFQKVPRWFNEGLAMMGSGKWGLDDRSWLTVAATLDSDTPIGDLDSKFSSSRLEVARAYALSGAFVRDLFQRSRPGLASDILARRASGLSFEEAFRRSLGAPIEGAESAFWRRHSILYRWLPLLTSSFALWLAIVGLTLLASWKKRRRRLLLEELWEEIGEGENPPN